MSLRPVLAIVPARSGSKGLPGKNLHPLAGQPLIAHSILFAKLCPEIDRCIVSTDSEEIADVARHYGADVPFLRPAHLATDEAPMWPVLQHAVRELEREQDRPSEFVLLLQPTSPCRIPEDVSRALSFLQEDGNAVGVVAVSEPEFNPRWVCVEERNGYMKSLFPESEAWVRRQDIPPTYRVNGLLYLWRRDYLLNAAAPQYDQQPHRMLVVPELRAADIDAERDLRMLELLIREGVIQLPWLAKASTRST